MTRLFDSHVYPPVPELFDGPLAPFAGGLQGNAGFDAGEMKPSDIVEYYRSRDARAVLMGWDSESVTNRRPLSSDDVASIVATAPDVLVGLGAVDPAKGAAAVGQVHHAARLGLSGIALHGATQASGPAQRASSPVWEAAAGHGLICFFQTGSTIFGTGTPGGGSVRLEYGRPLDVDVVAARLPDLRIVLVHGGTLWLDEAVAVAIHKSNVFLCLGGQSPAGLSSDVLEALNGPLADRVVFGSGFPFADPDDWVKKWDDLGQPASLTQKILNTNAAGLFGLAGS